MLVRKHETARQRVDNVNVGGGVSLWPDMENMRLNNQEVLQLAVLCAGLAAGVTLTFAFLHGILIIKPLCEKTRSDTNRAVQPQ